MSDAKGRQGGGWLLWLGVAGLLVFALIGLYFWWQRPTFTPDPQLLAELAAAELIDEPPPAEADWPQWRGVRRDGVSAMTTPRADWPNEGPPVVWRMALSGGQSSSAVAEGLVVTMTQDGEKEVVLALDAESGRERWRFPYAAKFAGPEVSGPSSTPCVADGRVYAVGATGILNCLDVESGKRLWDHDLLKEFGAPNLRWGTTFSPLVDGGLVFTNPGASRGSSVVAFDAKSGAVVWKALDDAAGYSSPIMMTAGGVRQVVFFTGAGLVGLKAADGKLLWRFPWETPHGVNASTPLWVRARAGERDLNYVFISSGYGKGCALVKVDGSEARPVYTGNALRAHFTSSVRVGGHIYGIDEGGFLTCLDLKTGRGSWRERGFGRGSVLVVGGALLALTEFGQVVVVEASPEEYRIRATWTALGEKCWPTPAVAGRRALFRDDKELTCFDLGSP